MSGNSVVGQATSSVSNTVNNSPKASDFLGNITNDLGGSSSAAFSAATGNTQGGKDGLENAINYAAPGIGGIATGIYNAVTNVPQPNLQNPATAGAPPTQAQTNLDALGASLASETQQAQSSSGVFLGAEGLDDAAPKTSSQLLLGT